MSLLKWIPKIIYDDINIGINFFTALGFEIKYSEDGFCILGRDALLIQVGAQHDDFFAQDRPEIRIETDDIEAFYQEIKARHPELLHPNLKVIKNQPWGLREFAVLDKTTVCVIIQQSI